MIIASLFIIYFLLIIVKVKVFKSIRYYIEAYLYDNKLDTENLLKYK